MNADPGLWAFIGYDPGPTSGIAWGTFSRFVGTGHVPGRRVWDVHAASSDPEGSLFILRAVLAEFNRMGASILYQGEKFVESRRRAGSQSDHETTREYAHYGAKIAKEVGGATVVLRPAADVKPWATDKRLERIGFPLAPKMKDSRDAGRHMLFAAVKSGRADDPLL